MTEQHEMASIMLSWQLALVDGVNVTVSVRKTCRKIMNKTKHAKVYDMCKALIECHPTRINEALEAGYPYYKMEMDKWINQ